MVWRRHSGATVEGEDGSESKVIESAVWYQRRGVHFLRWQEREQAGGSITLRIEPDSVTWIRHGMVAWTHVFRAGDLAASQMAVGAGALAVETFTERLTIEVFPVGGTIHLVYRMRMAGQGEQPERIELVIRWERQS
ncbi:DUF1934 domain-containing protein [Alicyclobacillus sacchari]|uniref:DUF1934 domain-containing protein n=1 Tax=Alicyclobacillus sacchari TaxID=392010 RepID=UPI001AB03B9B|nr:DUF1934 domain-containing protein [Alicyclobacillus sacchari]